MHTTGWGYRDLARKARARAQTGKHNPEGSARAARPPSSTGDQDGRNDLHSADKPPEEKSIQT